MNIEYVKSYIDFAKRSLAYCESHIINSQRTDKITLNNKLIEAKADIDRALKFLFEETQTTVKKPEA